MKYDTEKRAFLVKKFNEKKNNCLVKRAYPTKYKSRSTPEQKSHTVTVASLKKTGTVEDLPKKNP